MLEMIPLTVWYSLPVVLFFVVAWIIQDKLHHKIDSSSEKETKISSEEAARRLLEENELNSVVVEKGDNYTQNDYDREQEKVLLSPTTIGRKDFTSVGYAFYAVERAIHEKKHPTKTQVERKILVIETVTFWIAFSILAFGLMSCSLSMILGGYLTALVPAVLHFYSTNRTLHRITNLFNRSGLQQIFSDTEKSEFQGVLRAIILKY